MRLPPILTAGFWLLAAASANAATAPPSAPTTTVPFSSSATTSTATSTSTATFVSNARTYQPIQMKWQTVTLKEADFQKLVTRSSGDQDALAALLLKSGADKISTISIRSYDSGIATIAETSDVPYDTTNPTTQQQETDYIQTGLTATVQPKIIAPNLVSAYIKCSDTEAAAPSDVPGGPPSTKVFSTQNVRTLSNDHPVLVYDAPEVSSGAVQLYVITASFIPYDLITSR